MSQSVQKEGFCDCDGDEQRSGVLFVVPIGEIGPFFFFFNRLLAENAIERLRVSVQASAWNLFSAALALSVRTFFHFSKRNLDLLGGIFAHGGFAELGRSGDIVSPKLLASIVIEADKRLILEGA